MGLTAERENLGGLVGFLDLVLPKTPKVIDIHHVNKNCSVRFYKVLGGRLELRPGAVICGNWAVSLREKVGDGNLITKRRVRELEFLDNCFCRLPESSNLLFFGGNRLIGSMINRDRGWDLKSGKDLTAASGIQVTRHKRKKDQYEANFYPKLLNESRGRVKETPPIRIGSFRVPSSSSAKVQTFVSSQNGSNPDIVGVLVRCPNKTILVAKIGVEEVGCEINRAVNSKEEIYVTERGLVFPVRTKDGFATKICLIDFRPEEQANS